MCLKKKAKPAETISVPPTTPTASPQSSQSTIIYTPPQTHVKITKSDKEQARVIADSVDVPNKENQPIQNTLQNVSHQQTASIFAGANFHGYTFNINIPRQ